MGRDLASNGSFVAPIYLSRLDREWVDESPGDENSSAFDQESSVSLLMTELHESERLHEDPFDETDLIQISPDSSVALLIRALDEVGA